MSCAEKGLVGFGFDQSKTLFVSHFPVAIPLSAMLSDQDTAAVQTLVTVPFCLFSRNISLFVFIPSASL